MSFCKNCGNKTSELDKFCSSCGSAKGVNSITSRDNNINAINSEIKNNNIHIGDTYTYSNKIDPSTLNLTRYFIKPFWSKNKILAKRTTFVSLGSIGSIASIFSLYLSFPSNNAITQITTTIFTVFFIIMFSIGFYIKRSRFQHLIGLVNLETSKKDDIYLTRITCDCPWCDSKMKLRMIGPKENKKHQLLCQRNPSQHRILFDPTALSDIDDN